MKTNGNEPVMPVVEHTDGSTMRLECTELGLTKREHMAIEFTKALLSNSNHNHKNYGSTRIICDAIKTADELIKQLNQEEVK